MILDFALCSWRLILRWSKFLSCLICSKFARFAVNSHVPLTCLRHPTRVGYERVLHGEAASILNKLLCDLNKPGLILNKQAARFCAHCMLTGTHTISMSVPTVWISGPTIWISGSRDLCALFMSGDDSPPIMFYVELNRNLDERASSLNKRPYNLNKRLAQVCTRSPDQREYGISEIRPLLSLVEDSGYS